MSTTKRCNGWAVVVAQLIQQSLPTAEVHGSKPVIGKTIILNVHCELQYRYKHKEKKDWEWPQLKKLM